MLSIIMLGSKVHHIASSGIETFNKYTFYANNVNNFIPFSR